MVDFFSAIAGGVLTGAATLSGQLLLARREDKRWARQYQIQQEEWGREDRKLAFDYRRDSYVELVSLHHEWQQLVFDHLQNDRDLERRLLRLKTLEAVENEFSYLLDDYYQNSQKILAKVRLTSPKKIAELAEQAVEAVFQYHYRHTPEGSGHHLPLGTEENAHRLLVEFIGAAKLDLESAQSPRK